MEIHFYLLLFLRPKNKTRLQSKRHVLKCRLNTVNNLYYFLLFISLWNFGEISGCKCLRTLLVFIHCCSYKVFTDIPSLSKYLYIIYLANIFGLNFPKLSYRNGIKGFLICAKTSFSVVRLPSGRSKNPRDGIRWRKKITN